MKALINWLDWMKDGTVVVMDEFKDIFIHNPYTILTVHEIPGYSGFWASETGEAGFQIDPDLTGDFISPEYLDLDWKESKIVKGEG